MQLIERLKNNFSHLFNFEDNYSVGDYEFDLYAIYFQHNLKYFGSKKVKLWEFNNNEHLFIKDLGDGKINLDEINDCFLYMYNNFIEADENHCASVITLIYMIDELDDALKKKIKKFKFYKSYKFGYHGYVTGKLIVIDKGQNAVYESKAAKGDAVKMRLLG